MAQERQHPWRVLEGSPMWSENETRNAVPVSCDDKRSLQAPRRTEHGTEDGGRHRVHSASAAEAWKVHERGASGASPHSRTDLRQPCRVENSRRLPDTDDLAFLTTSSPLVMGCLHCFLHLPPLPSPLPGRHDVHRTGEKYDEFLIGGRNTGTPKRGLDEREHGTNVEATVRLLRRRRIRVSRAELAPVPRGFALERCAP